MCFPYLARDKWWDRDFENCFGIRPVTTIRKMWVQSKTWRQWLKIGVLQGSKTTSAFCKLRLPNFAQDESSNHDSENCSEISAVTRFRICLELLHFPTFMFFTPPYCTSKLKKKHSECENSDRAAEDLNEERPQKLHRLTRSGFILPSWKSGCNCPR